MPRNPTETRARIYAAAYALFYRKGFQRTSLDDIAAKAGVTKRTLYYHVRSKDDLAGAMLAHQHGFVLQEMARWMGEAATPRRLVDQLFDSVARWMTVPASKRRWTGSGFTRMAMELADLPGHPARGAPPRPHSAVAAQRARPRPAGGPRNPADRAAQLQMLLEGAMILMLIHGEARYAKLAAAAARQLVMRHRP